MTAWSLHLGLDAVDPAAYQGWAGRLRAGEADARAMQALAAAQGFTTTLLTTADATYPRLVAELERAATMLTGGDFLLVTFAGHGASFDDVVVMTADRGVASGLGDEPDHRDEAWCLHDGFVLDDELHDCLCKLPAGLRVCVVSDSCFAGTVTRVAPSSTMPRPDAPRPPGTRGLGPSVSDDRRVPPAIARAVRRRHHATYAARKRAAATSRGRAPAAEIVLLAACQDAQSAREQADLGVFTARLLATWDGGRFAGDHRGLIAAIAATMPAIQTPNLHVTGARRGLVEARPFTP